MEKLTIREIAQALKIPCPMDGEVTGICTDSRQVTASLWLSRGRISTAMTLSGGPSSRGPSALWSTTLGTTRREGPYWWKIP